MSNTMSGLMLLFKVLSYILCLYRINFLGISYAYTYITSHTRFYHEWFVLCPKLPISFKATEFQRTISSQFPALRLVKTGFDKPSYRWVWIFLWHIRFIPPNDIGTPFAPFRRTWACRYVCPCQCRGSSPYMTLHSLTHSRWVGSPGSSCHLCSFL